MDTKNKLLIVAGTAAMLSPLAAGGDYDLLRSYTLSQAAAEYKAINTHRSNIKVAIQLQTRYQINSRDDASTALSSPDDDLTVGFVVRRAKVSFLGSVSDNIKGKLQIGFDRKTGATVLEDAVFAWKMNDDLTLRIGQFKPGVMREEHVSSKRQLSAERSATNKTFGQDYTQGMELGFGGGGWRATISLTDGFGADNTAIDSTSEADYGVSARAEFLIADGEFGQFKQFTSFRGSSAGGMIGIAAYHESMGKTNLATIPTTGMTTATADFSWTDDGWNIFAAGIWRSMDAGTMRLDDYGIVLQGGMFVSDADEVFARWSTVMPDSDNGAGSDGDYSDVTIGWNHFMIPESHAAKFTLAMTYSLDAVDASIVETSEGHNLFADSEDGQVGLIAQFQVLF
ncbi:MAG: hypothetical protein JKY96_08315 [Phycisphaerales bacterium]|nr:hypothetical protein [Phycisphaerales bacterium]